MRNSLNLYQFPQEIVQTPQGQACRLKLPQTDPQDLPTVSILTPTYNRKIFKDLMLRNWNAIDYPRNKLEWIIVDDSQEGRGLNPRDFQQPNIRYLRIPKKITIGKKRNFLASLAKHQILVHFDDDDYYPPESVVARVKCILNSNKQCTGCTKTLCYDLLHDQTFEAYDPSDDDFNKPCTISESSMAYTKEFWLQGKYNDNDTRGECLNFIQNRHDQIVEIPYIFVVTQLSHSNNTIKRWMTGDTKHTVQFTDNIPLMDLMLIQNLRANVIVQFPEWKKAISFVKRYNKVPKKKYLKLMESNPHLSTNPLVINQYQQYITKKSSNRDIIWYCGPGNYLKHSNPWDGRTTDLGGSEEAVVNICEGLAKRGFNVSVYNLVDSNKTINGVKYIPYWKWIPGDKQLCTVVWRDPSILDTKINSDVVLLDLHDVIDHQWLTPERLENLDYIMCKSNYHRDLYSKVTDRIKIIPNGINVREYKNNFNTTRQKNIITCTSSPDRCIMSLLDALPIIRERYPYTEIHWAYGFKHGVNKGGIESNNNPKVKEWYNKVMEKINNTEGFYNLGRLTHQEVAKLLQKSNIYAYGTHFPEIDCISITKAMVSGCIPIVTPVAALNEKMKFCGDVVHTQCEGCVDNIEIEYGRIDYSNSGFGDFDGWVGSLMDQLSVDVGENRRCGMSDSVCRVYDWDNIINGWISVVNKK